MLNEVFRAKEILEKPGILRIGVDLDANVVDLMDPAHQLIKETLGVDVEQRLKEGPADFFLEQWPEIQSIPGGPEFVMRIYEEPFVYEEAKPIPGSVEVLNKWKQEDHEIWFISARPKKTLEQVTITWLDKYNLGWGKEKLLLFSSEKSRIEFKENEAKRLKLHVFIEDHGPTVKVVDSSSMMVKLVLAYSWNVNENIGFESAFIYNQDWQEMDRVIQGMSRWHYFLTRR